MRMGPSVGPRSTWGESRALSGAREHLGIEWGPKWGQGVPGSTWGENGAHSGAREHPG